MRPQTSEDRPRRSRPSPAFLGGQQLQLQILGPHHPNHSLGSSKALPARVTRFGIGIQDLPSDLLSWGLGLGSLQLQKRPRSVRSGHLQEQPPMAPLQP